MIDFQQRIDLGKESSLLVWYPKIKDLPIPQVKTVIVNTGHKILSEWIRKDKPMSQSMWDKLESGMNKIGKFPVFMRTDQASIKHDWKNTCFVENKDKMKHNLSMLVEGHEMQNMAGELSYDAVVFREFLDLESSFTTDYYSDFPVNKEVRCFIRDGELVSMHNYWFEDAVEKGHPHDVKWRDKLKKLNKISDTDNVDIVKQLEKISPNFKNYWSVDFAKGKNGKWYCIDMARGEVSYHPENILWKGKNYIVPIKGDF